jgi:hypothetical protein
VRSGLAEAIGSAFGASLAFGASVGSGALGGSLFNTGTAGGTGAGGGVDARGGEGARGILKGAGLEGVGSEARRAVAGGRDEAVTAGGGAALGITAGVPPLVEPASRLATSGGRADCAARAARTDNGVTEARGNGVRPGVLSEMGGREAGRDVSAAGSPGALGGTLGERLGVAGELARDGSANPDRDGAGSEELGSGGVSFGRMSAGTVGSLGMTGEISGLALSCSASPAHSESISSVSGALERARDGGIEASSNDCREGTGVARSLPGPAGVEDVTVGGGPEGTPASCPEPDFSEVLLVLEPFFFPRRPFALIALRETIWRVFAKKARTVSAKPGRPRRMIRQSAQRTAGSRDCVESTPFDTRGGRRVAGALSARANQG